MKVRIDFRKARNKAFEDGDMDWCKRMLPALSSRKVVEMAFHKARLECTDVSDKVRIESRDWLLQRGLTRFDGSPVDPFGLPK